MARVNTTRARVRQVRLENAVVTSIPTRNPLGFIFGADPEGFFVDRHGVVVGSEMLIPVEGIPFGEAGVVTRDGVQFELHPNPGDLPTLRANISTLLVGLMDYATERGYKVSFTNTYQVPRATLDSLSPASRQLGCQPSLNIYGTQPLVDNPETYQWRSAGGHIHFGVDDKFRAELPRAIYLQDMFTGLFSLLFDRDVTTSVTRRRNYGRAGEYRLPNYGIEYRTPSNFWLRDPGLMTFIFNFAQFGMEIFLKAANGDPKLWNELAGQTAGYLSYVRAMINIGRPDYYYNSTDAIAKFVIKNLPTEGYSIQSKDIQRIAGNFAGVPKLAAGWENTILPENQIRERWLNHNEPFSEFLDRTFK